MTRVFNGETSLANVSIEIERAFIFFFSILSGCNLLYPPRMTQIRPEIIILTGAGLSAESGIPTFRGADGLWQGRRVEEVATAEAVACDPWGVNAFFNKRRRDLAGIEPNAAHRALAEAETYWGERLLVVTQNIDPLHEKAGSRNLIHMHGELLRIRCDACGESAPFHADATETTPCPLCGKAGALRPDVVLFGEMPFQMDRVIDALSTCRVFIAIGTSGVVYPAAGFVDLAHRAGARTIELNLAATERSPAFQEKISGPASVTVPVLIEKMKAEEAAA